MIDELEATTKKPEAADSTDSPPAADQDPWLGVLGSIATVGTLAILLAIKTVLKPDKTA